jgi:Ig-like domain-containing protein
VLTPSRLNALRLLFSLSLWLVACGQATATPTMTPSPTTPAPPATAVIQQPTGTPPPTETPAQPAETPTPEPPCANNSQFISDLTVPDGTQLLPGQPFVKKWSVENTGTCDWGPDYRLVLTSGDSLGAASEVALYPARAGAAGVWEVPMIAPFTPGQYTSRWQARDPGGNLFGGVVFVKIEVIPLPVTDTPTP